MAANCRYSKRYSAPWYTVMNIFCDVGYREQLHVWHFVQHKNNTEHNIGVIYSQQSFTKVNPASPITLALICKLMVRLGASLLS